MFYLFLLDASLQKVTMLATFFKPIAKQLTRLSYYNITGQAMQYSQFAPRSDYYLESITIRNRYNSTFMFITCRNVSLIYAFA